MTAGDRWAIGAGRKTLTNGGDCSAFEGRSIITPNRSGGRVESGSDVGSFVLRGPESTEITTGKSRWIDIG